MKNKMAYDTSDDFWLRSRVIQKLKRATSLSYVAQSCLDPIHRVFAFFCNISYLDWKT